tara:strand:+ start:320 stop:622 length:303 start_codon:yes stop_codon:yes gene_type:complete
MKNHYKNNTFHINYVIYEKNDTAILLDGVVTKNHKQYFTSIPIDPVNFSYLCEKTIGYEKTNYLWSQLFTNSDLVTELIPKHHLGLDLSFSSSEPKFNIN